MLESSSVLGATIAFAVGILTAILNVSAGGGSLLTIPLLVELGLPPQVANATNRISVIVQGLTSTATFARQRVLPVHATLRLLPATLTGAFAGAWLASVLDERSFRGVLAALFIAMGIALLLERVDPARSAARAEAAMRTLERGPWWVHALMLPIGVYGGFIQAGTGILMLFLMHLAMGLDLRRANAIKMALTFAFNVVTLGVFLHHGLIDWTAGIWLTAGSFVGGWYGARVASRINMKWLRRALIVAVFAGAARFAGWI